jgi:exopolysaccharide biosynthesis predicted pyruvyltransferase EpsI
MTNHHADIQIDTVRVLSDLLPPGTRVALVDFPNHKNAGDHLIFRGEIEYLRQLEVSVDYIADATRYDKTDLEALAGLNAVILIHGGGNFGDRWKEAQEFHELVIAENHDHRIIQLPQGIEFSDGPVLHRVQESYGAHPALTLMLRDHVGFETASRLFPNNVTVFCPDMAFGNLAIGDETNPHAEVLYLRRQDSESKASSVVSLASTITFVDADWGLSVVDEIKWKLLHIPGAIARRVPMVRRRLYPIQRRAYFAIADLNLKSATRILSEGQVVLTDRLHAAVLGALMGKPVVAIDNANGKISAIYGDYFHLFDNVQLADSPGEANSIIRGLLDKSGSR